MREHFPPIGILRTCFKEKFGVPRQSLMMSEARAVLKLNPDPQYATALSHLDEFSHVWLVFVFHKNASEPWRPIIEPPRLEAPPRIGVFASRSPHRPNPIGLSAVKLEKIDREAEGGIEIHLSGVDLLDGTPVLDIKPYLPFADRIEDATAGWAQDEIEKFPVEFSPESEQALEGARERHPRLRQLLEQMLEWDPRPTSQRRNYPARAPASEGKPFAFRVLDFDVHWRIQRGVFHVTEIRNLPN